MIARLSGTFSRNDCRHSGTLILSAISIRLIPGCEDRPRISFRPEPRRFRRRCDRPSRGYPSPTSHVLSGNPRLHGYIYAPHPIALQDGTGRQADCDFAGLGDQPLAQGQSWRFAETPGCAGRIAHRQQHCLPRSSNIAAFPADPGMGNISCRACSINLAGFAQVAGIQINHPRLSRLWLHVDGGRPGLRKSSRACSRERPGLFI